ncbi:hypothetical protein [Halorientalis marina]|uniref:hypothetical protein n=1 Tax=Halorientalis marina TaxID=2931976 RepID=UPI001FF47E1D|nr:hypothetical protein [Halorientalis marina]
MGDYVDPNETDPSKWRGSTPRDGRDGGRAAIRSVVERALATETPYQRTGTRVYGPAVVREEFDSRDYHHAKVYYDGGVTTDGGIKLLTRGYLWGDDERHQRYKSQYRRPPDPADEPPFGEYTVWNQYQFGTASRDAEGELVFEPDPDGSDEYVRSVDWGDLYTPVQGRLVELELVRNPPFARYRLDERGEWTGFGRPLTYDLGAFDAGP